MERGIRGEKRRGRGLELEQGSEQEKNEREKGEKCGCMLTM